MRLDGKTALITGGGTGVGQATARLFAEEGGQVVIVGRREQPLQATCQSCTGPKPVEYRVADVGNRAQALAVAEEVTGRFGRIDILVNNAGVNVRKRLLAELSPEDWDHVMNVNATGAFNLVHAVLPQMRARRDGVIISISSIAGCRPSVLGGAAYSASKHAMSALTKVIGLEELENGIRATVISPGEIDTPILEDRPVKVSDAHRARILQADDVAVAALFVATLPPRANVPELIIKPTTQAYA